MEKMRIVVKDSEDTYLKKVWIYNEGKMIHLLEEDYGQLIKVNGFNEFNIDVKELKKLLKLKTKEDEK